MGKTATIQLMPTVGASGRLEVQQVNKVGRKQRRPSHPFYLEYRPYELQPFMIAPVLPGETMKNALLQARCVTDPIKNPLIGWWNEYYLFYVKLSDLTLTWEGLGGSFFDKLTEMLLQNTAPTDLDGIAITRNYQLATGVNYLQTCMHAIVANYFRDEDESDETGVNTGFGSSGALLAKVNMNNALQSLSRDDYTAAAETEELPGEGYDALPAHLSGFSDAFAQWKELVAMRMTEATFDDWLKSFGVTPPREQREELHIPELLRYVREFQYPSNTVSPADGSVASAVSWSIAERADKDRFFAEPGFIVGVTTARPKVYLSAQKGYMAQFMNDAFSWLPAVLQDSPFTSLKKFDEVAGAGPVDGIASDYWVDLRDMFMHGDQFVNVAMTSDKLNIVSLPDDLADAPRLIGSYPTDADLTAFFKVAASNKIRVDGRCDLSILSRIEDTTP